MDLLPIPWMRQKLEAIYDTNLYGNLYLMYCNFDLKNYVNTQPTVLLDLLDDYNIEINQNNPLYLYFPMELEFFMKDLIISFKSISKENIYIVLGGYKENYKDLNSSDIIINLYNKYPELNDKIDFTYLVDNSKCYEIYTSLCDTHRVCINPNSSCCISGFTLNYHMKKSNPNNTNHISFVNLLNDNITYNHVDCYLKGLTNNNNNFNINL